MNDSHDQAHLSFPVVFSRSREKFLKQYLVCCVKFQIEGVIGYASATTEHGNQHLNHKIKA